MRFFRAARLRLLRSYGALGQLPTPLQAEQGLVELVVVGLGDVPVADRGPHRRPVEHGEVDPPGDDAVLDVVDGVGDVVREVHHLRLEALAPALDAVAQPGEHGQVVLVDPELADQPLRPVGVHALRLLGLRAGPGVLGARVEGGPGEVQPDRTPVLVERLGLEPGQQPQGLGIALETAAVLAELRQHPLAVVAERRVAEVVGQRRRLRDVGVATQRPGQVARDLGHLEAVGQPVADEVVGAGPDHLGLRGQPPERRGVHHAGPVPLEGSAHGSVDPLRRLVDDPLAGRGVVLLG